MATRTRGGKESKTVACHKGKGLKRGCFQKKLVWVSIVLRGSPMGGMQSLVIEPSRVTLDPQSTLPGPKRAP